MDAEEEKRLIDLILTGDDDARAELTARWMPWLSVFASNFLRRRGLFSASYSDLRQECALAFWRALPRFDPQRGWPLKTFITPRVRGAALDFLRGQGRLGQRRTAQCDRIQTVSLTDEVGEWLASDDDPIGAGLESIDAVRVIAARLDGRQKEVVLLRYVHGLTYVAIGRRLGFSESSAWQAHRTAIRRLREITQRPIT